MYEKDGIIYVEGIEDEFMQWHLTFMKHRYKHVLKKEDPTPEQTARIQEAEEQFRLRRLAKANPYLEMFNPEPPKKEDPKPKKVGVVVTPSAEQLAKQKQKEYSRKWYEKHRDEILAKQKKPNSKYGTLHIPAPAGTKEYNQLYWERYGEERNKARRKKTTQNKKTFDRKAYQKQWREEHKEYIREYHKQWREKNKEKVRGYQKAFLETHGKDYCSKKTNEYQKQRYHNDPEYREHALAIHHRYYERHREQILASQYRRRAEKKKKAQCEK